MDCLKMNKIKDWEDRVGDVSPGWRSQLHVAFVTTNDATPRSVTPNNTMQALRPYGETWCESLHET
jgi:hypothetical protein